MTQDIVWQKSTFSGGGDSSDCVELAADCGTVRLRESDEPARVLSATRAGLAELIREVKAGHLDG